MTLHDTKNRSDHRILLSRQALEIASVHCEGRAAEEPLFPILDARKTLKAINAWKPGNFNCTRLLEGATNG